MSSEKPNQQRPQPHCVPTNPAHEQSIGNHDALLNLIGLDAAAKSFEKPGELPQAKPAQRASRQSVATNG